MRTDNPVLSGDGRRWTLSYSDQRGGSQKISSLDPPWTHLTTILKLAGHPILPAFIITLGGPKGYLMASREPEGFEVIVTKVVPRPGMTPLFSRYGAVRQDGGTGGCGHQALSQQEMTELVMHFPQADDLPPPMAGFTWIDMDQEVLERFNPALRELRTNPRPSMDELRRSDPEKARQMAQEAIEEEATRHYGPPAERQAKNLAHVERLVQQYSERAVRGILIALSSLEKPWCARWMLKHDLAHDALDEIIKFHDLNGPRINILGERRGRYTVTIGGGWGDASDLGTFMVMEKEGRWEVDKMLSFCRS